MTLIKRFLAIFTVIAVFITSVFSFPVLANSNASAQSPFKDVQPTAWYYGHVQWAYNTGVISGKGDDLFDPKGICTRAEFVAMLCRLDMGSTANLDKYIKDKPTFNDVPKGMWYEKYVEWAYDNKYVSGTGDNQFSPNNKISRQEMVKMVHNYFVAKGELPDFSDIDITKSFKDAKSVADWAKEAVAFAYKTTIIKGIPDGNGFKFSPKANNTRAEAATVFHNIFDYKNMIASLDTDQDELKDIDEPKYKTDPNNPDTDGDGAKDGLEVYYGTDPLKADQDFSQSLSSGTVSEETPVSARVDIELKGEQLGTLDVSPVGVEENVLLSSNIPGYLGSAYDFEVQGEFDEATISFNYDTALGELGEDFQPKIYYLNEETGLLEKLPDQEVNNGVISAKVKHFSKYILLNEVEFELAWASDIRKPRVGGKSHSNGDIDIVFVVDESNSMENMKSGSSNDPERIRVKAIKKFIDQLSSNDRAAIIGFSSSSRTLIELTNDHEAVITQADMISGSIGGTQIYKGINEGINELRTNGRTDADKIMIVLTDGEDNPLAPTGAYEEAIASAGSDITIYTVGLGNDVGKVLLTYIAESTGGRFFQANTADDVYLGYQNIQDDTFDYRTDSNQDGISDYYAKLIWSGELRLQNGSLEMLPLGMDLNCSNDIDGDGLLNGEEVVVVEMGERVMLRFVSDPYIVDSDGDGYDDKEDPHPLARDYFTKNVKELYDLVNNSSFKYFQEADRHVHDFWAQAGTVAVTALSFTDLQKEYTMEMVNFFKNNINENYINELQLSEIDRLVAIENDANIAFFIEQLSENTDNIKNKVDRARKIEATAAGVAHIVEAKMNLSEARKLAKSERSIAAYKGWVTRRQKQAIEGIRNPENVTVQIPLARMATKGMKPETSRRIVNNMKKIGKDIDKAVKAFDTATKVVSVVALLNSGYELWDAYESLSSNNANIIAYENNTDLLKHLSTYSDNTFTRGAADFILDTMAGEAQTANSQLFNHMFLGTLSILDVITAATPFWAVKAAKATFDVCDSLFGWSDGVKSMAKVICLYDMSNATLTFINRNYLVNNKYENTGEKFGRHLENLVNMRIVGEYRYMGLKGKENDKTALENINKVTELAKKWGLFLQISKL